MSFRARTRSRTLLRRVVEGAVRAFNRNRWSHHDLHLVGRHPEYPLYDLDCLATQHIHSFIGNPEFERAYSRAVSAAGWDYGIHWRVHTVLWAAALGVRAEGAFVECGTGRGFMASAICEHQAWLDRPFFLVDTFDPRALAAGGEDPDADSPISSHYATSVADIRENFRQWPGVQVVVGRVPQVLNEVPVAKVAFLHIDMNHFVPEVAALRHFWPKMSVGGVIIFDDYAFLGHQTQHDALNEAASELGFSILSLPTGQGLAIKPAGDPPAG